MTAPGAGPVRAVYFDVGETLIDESTEYGTWADWLDVPRYMFSAVFGDVIARGEDYRQVFEHFRPGIDLAGNAAAGGSRIGEYFNGRDLYPDVRGCLATLKGAVTSSASPATRPPGLAGSCTSCTSPPT